MIELRKTLQTVKDLFTKEKIEFALIGGFALSAHGVHRATTDIDILVGGKNQDQIIKILLSSGFKLRHQTKEVAQFSGIGNLDIVFANRPLSLEMIQKSKMDSKIGVSVVSAEGLIGLKIQAYKNDPKRKLQDQADIQSLLRTQNMDMKQLKIYADLFNAWEEIQELTK